MSALLHGREASRPLTALLAAARGASLERFGSPRWSRGPLSQANVLLQLEHLRTYRWSRAEKESGCAARLLVDIGTRGARLRPGQDRFVPLDERRPNASLAPLQCIPAAPFDRSAR